MNVFFARLLFCFFAENTDIFKKNAFTNAIASHRQDDGSDLSTYISRLFQRLNDKKDSKYPAYLGLQVFFCWGTLYLEWLRYNESLLW